MSVNNVVRLVSGVVAMAGIAMIAICFIALSRTPSGTGALRHNVGWILAPVGAAFLLVGIFGGRVLTALIMRAESDREAGATPGPPAAASHGAVPVLSIDGARFGVVAVPEAKVTRGEVTRLRGASEPADAVVAGSREVILPPGAPSSPAGVVDVALEVTRPDRFRYGTVMRVPCATPRSRALISTAGTPLSVRVHPVDRRVLAIDMASVS